MGKQTIRPEHLSDLDIIWAIRDIPTKVLCIKLKSILYTFVSLIGNSTNEYYYKSHEDLAPIIGISSRRLPALLDKLENLKFLKIKRPKNYTKGDSNEYKLLYLNIIKEAEFFRAQLLGRRSVR